MAGWLVVLLAASVVGCGPTGDAVDAAGEPDAAETPDGGLRDGAAPDVWVSPTCGDGVIDLGETCDDAEALRSMARLGPSRAELEALVTAVRGSATARDLEALTALASELSARVSDPEPLSSLVDALLAREDLRGAEAHALAALRGALRNPRDPGSLDRPGAPR